ncbi:MarR family winged helix-turn-helix transcriptional regulator [Mucilaginibacter aquaedulcis]|uniref:MarR family winged helix-turn-helix transcriptional regulator n=1 Tax=Mucilaginibacter aquaedulcis TaxID=1187081 RepID=UPI0025B479BF|nr:MarR family transcriptional regulator [Mucilaginibacter aquaedulcis]MDN3547344.1 MarR family transcriptional regulator [Mucilaginibacter aquaedulcis]
MTKENDILLASELRAVVTRLTKKMRKESSTAAQLSLTERSTIALLDQHGELLPTELAAMEKITTQSMSQILNKLLLLGIIKRRISETDKRKAIITLSDEGRTLLYQVRHEREEWLNKALDATCTEEEKALLKKAIGPLTKLVDFD